MNINNFSMDFSIKIQLCHGPIETAVYSQDMKKKFVYKNNFLYLN